MLNIIMIDKIISHIFIYKISSFLNLDDKKNIKQTNIYLKNIINKKIYSHIGNILLHHLGYLKNDINDFKKDLITFDMTYCLIIINTLLSYGCFKSSKQKVFVTSSISNIKAGVLFRIIASDKDKCISMLKKTKKYLGNLNQIITCIQIWDAEIITCILEKNCRLLTHLY